MNKRYIPLYILACLYPTIKASQPITYTDSKLIVKHFIRKNTPENKIFPEEIKSMIYDFVSSYTTKQLYYELESPSYFDDMYPHNRTSGKDTLYLGYADKLHILDLKNKQLRSCPYPLSNPVEHISVSANKRLCTTHGRAIIVWDEKQKNVEEVLGVTSCFGSKKYKFCHIHPDGKNILAMKDKLEVMHFTSESRNSWDYVLNSKKISLADPPIQYSDNRFTYDKDFSLFLWNRKETKILKIEYKPCQHAVFCNIDDKELPTYLKASTNYVFLATMNNKNQHIINIFDKQQGTLMHKIITMHNYPISHLAVMQDGSALLSSPNYQTKGKRYLFTINRKNMVCIQDFPVKDNPGNKITLIPSSSLNIFFVCINRLIYAIKTIR